MVTQLSVTPAPRDPMACLASVCMWCTNIQAGKTPIYINIIKYLKIIKINPKDWLKGRRVQEHLLQQPLWERIASAGKRPWLPSLTLSVGPRAPPFLAS